MKEKKGISLIVLIVTIIVMIIIAGAIILSLSDTNIIDQAESATQKHNISQIKEQINVENALREGGLSGRYIDRLDTGSLEEIGIEDEDLNNKLLVQDGKLVYRPENVTSEEATKYLSEGIEAGDYIGVVNSDDSKANYKNTTNIILASELQSTLENDRFATIFILEDITIDSFTEIYYPDENGQEVGFKGIIDGLEHTITRTGGETMLYMNEGTIKNITIEGSLEVWSGSSIIEFNNGTVLNCHNKADITGYMLGGIAYINGGKIINCSNEGNLYSDYASGGVVQQNEINGIISCCFNSGAINLNTDGTIDVGGIAGSNAGIISNCYNTANISTNFGYMLFGIATTADSGKTISSYNIGQINSTQATATTGSGKTSNLYSIEQTNTSTTKGEGTEWIEDLGATELEQKTKLLKKLNASNSTKIWVEDTNNINNGYPILYWQAK